MVQVLEATQLLARLADPDAFAALIDTPLLAVDERTVGGLDDRDQRAMHAVLSALPAVTLAVTEAAEARDPASSGPALGAFSCLVSPDDAALIEARVEQTPRAAVALDALLRITERLPGELGLVAEAHTYSMLLAGTEFTAWREHQRRRRDPDPSATRVASFRERDNLVVTMCRPAVHNAFDAAMRDALCAALDVARCDPSIESVVLAGQGRSFCSGGALWEFGTAEDVVAASAARLARNPGRRLQELAGRVVVELHGACIGAGIELAAFASVVRAAPDTWARLPELEMGLVPGAGGTVSLPHRIGRQRTAYLALTGHRIDVDTMMRWGLADRIVDRDPHDSAGV